MIYGDEKRLQMARSILTCSQPKSARENLASIKRRHRSKINRLCDRLTRDEDLWDDQAEVNDYPDHEIRDEVRNRRYADKLSHFETWAVHITKDMPREDRLSFMRSILPDGLIGRHSFLSLSPWSTF